MNGRVGLSTVVRGTVRYYEDMLALQRPWVHGHLIDLCYYCHAGRRMLFPLY